MAGIGADPDERQGGGTSDGSNLIGRVAGIGKIGSEEDRSVGGLGADECRQRQKARLPQDEGRESGSAECAVHLYMSTLVATRYNPLIQAQYQQLLKRGKVKKVALTACMRKFLTILNAMMRDQTSFRQTVTA